MMSSAFLLGIVDGDRHASRDDHHDASMASTRPGCITRGVTGSVPSASRVPRLMLGGVRLRVGPDVRHCRTVWLARPWRFRSAGERFRPEHRSALTWLNTISEEGFGFFGLSLEVWRIGESAPAPRLRVDVQPDDWVKSVKATASHELTDTQHAYTQLWTAFLGYFHSAQPGRSRAFEPPTQSWMNFLGTPRSSLRSGLL